MAPQTDTIQTVNNHQANSHKTFMNMHATKNKMNEYNQEPINNNCITGNEQFQQSHNNIKSTSFDYSLNEQLSLHSYFSSDQIGDLYHVKNDSMSSQSYSQLFERSLFFKTNSLSSELQFPLISSKLTNADIIEESSQNQFLKSKNKDDILELHASNEITEGRKIQKVTSKDDKARKSYTSYLHEAVDKNHLQSPSHKLMFESQKNSKFFQFKLESADLDPQNEKNKPKDSKLDQKQLNPYQNPQNIKNQPLIKPVIIKQNLKGNSKQSSNFSNLSPLHKPKTQHRLSFRKIPQTLCESYDQLLLTINKNEKPLNKHPLNSPIKLKEKSQLPIKKSDDSKQNQTQKSQGIYQQNRPNNISTKLIKNNDDQQLLVNLPIIEGSCQIRKQNQDFVATKFVINKNQILFQTSKTLIINHITKIKLIQKDEGQICIKISYQPQINKKPQITILKLLSSLQEVYFSQSYNLFSQIILRKLLLMKLSINEVNEKIQRLSPVRSSQSSPIISPINSPSTMVGRVSQNIVEENVHLTSELFKKSGLFNSWQKKYFNLTQNCLQTFSYPPSKEHKSKPSSNLYKTSQIWTRFQLIYGYLVIKMWQSKIQKVQIGIPLCDFSNIEGKSNWLFGLSKFIVWKKN